MFKNFGKALVPLLVVFMGLLVGAQSAYAQTTWLPDFDAGKHVYLDPQLANDPNFPVRFNRLEEELAKRGQKHGLQIYVVATKQGSDASAHSSVPAVAKVNELTLKWQSQGYPAGDALIIVWVRFDNPNDGSMAANGGSKLRGFGVDKSDFDADNGPVRSVLPIYLPNDPQGAFLAIADNVNKMVDDYKAAEQAQKDHDAAMRALPGKIAIAVIILVILGTIGWLYVRFNGAKTANAERINKRSEMLDSANAFYIKLYEGYFGFVKEQSDWSTKFKGRTLTEYTAALSDFAEFTVRQKAANKRLDDARKAAAESRFPSIAGFRKSDALLETDPVVITGAELPLEMATLFGGLVKKTTYTPAGLLDAMSDLFDRTNKALAGIVKAFREGEQNKKDLDELLGQIRLKQAAMGASFDAYLPFLQKLETAQRDLAAAAGDPLSVFEKSVSAENEARALVAELDRAAAKK